jgi:D-sedoheptulose 7-phosphate isomerase
VADTGFLYPFLEGAERDAGALLADLERSATAKAAESAALAAATLAEEAPSLERAAAAIAARVVAGGRIFVFGNGGSATDAANLAALFAGPPAWLPARALVDDAGVLTALANDVGFDVVFSRQLIAHARAGDVAVGLSTSGGSENVLAAFAEGRRRGLLTVGLAGYDGGRMATSGDVDHCLVVRSASVHRIQEVQAVLGMALWRRVVAGVGGG